MAPLPGTWTIPPLPAPDAGVNYSPARAATIMQAGFAAGVAYLSTDLVAKYGAIDVPAVVRGRTLVDSEKRLLTLLVNAFGTSHQSIDDLTDLVLNRRNR